jgi:AcrR family transcriptional regulator
MLSFYTRFPEGADKLTTNYLARKAGFSIGTIYQSCLQPAP